MMNTNATMKRTVATTQIATNKVCSRLNVCGPKSSGGTPIKTEAVLLNHLGTSSSYNFLGGAWTILRNASKRSLRFGTGISKPFGVVCVGSSLAGCCGLSVIRGEVSAHGRPLR